MSMGRKTFCLAQWYGVALKQVTMPCAFPMWLAAWSAWMSLTPKITETMFRNMQSGLLRGIVFSDAYLSHTLGKLCALVHDRTLHVHKLPWDLISEVQNSRKIHSFPHPGARCLLLQYLQMVYLAEQHLFRYNTLVHKLTFSSVSWLAAADSSVKSKRMLLCFTPQTHISAPSLVLSRAMRQNESDHQNNRKLMLVTAQSYNCENWKREMSGPE